MGHWQPEGLEKVTTNNQIEPYLLVHADCIVDDLGSRGQEWRLIFAGDRIDGFIVLCHHFAEKYVAVIESEDCYVAEAAVNETNLDERCVRFTFRRWL